MSTSVYTVRKVNTSRSKKWKFVISIITAIILYSCSSKPEATTAPPPPTFPVVSVTSGNQTTYQEYPASIEGTVNVEIRPQISGALDKVYVDEGAYVHAGQPIFKINDQPYRAALSNAMASLHSAEASYGNAQLEIDKLTPLVVNKVVSDYQLKSAKAALQVAKANIESAKANVSTAKINLAYTVIKAPVGGYIGRLLKKQGSLVTSQDIDALTQLSDVHEVHVYFSLAEQEFVGFKNQYRGASLKDKLKNLPPVSLLLADGSVFGTTGKIDVIDGQFDKTTGAITVRATFSNPQGLLRAGNTGKVRLSLIHENATIVPESATIEMQDKVFVFALADSNKVKRVPINIIGRSAGNYLINSGVKAGDQIVLSGIDRLQEGTIINPERTTEQVATVSKK